MITIRKLWNWVCNCFSNPPRPGVNLDNDCYGPNATGAGQNPLNGLICTEPSQFTPPYTQAVDPPTCYTGVSPCDPMPTLWRVAFPCRVPGSTCSGTGTGTGSTTCTCSEECFRFVVSGFSGPGDDGVNGTYDFQLCNELGFYVLGSNENDHACVVQGAMYRAPFDPEVYAFITIRSSVDVNWFITWTYLPDQTFCKGSMDFTGGQGFWPDATFQPTITVIRRQCGGGTGTGTAPLPPVVCDPIEVLTHPTGPPPVVPPYQDCPSCWTMNPSGIGSGTGGVSDTCCESLNGLKTLCYAPSVSQGANLVWGTDCVSSGTGGGDECTIYEWYNVDTFSVVGDPILGFTCPSTYNGDFVFQAYPSNGYPTGCRYIVNNAGDVYDGSLLRCWPNDSVSDFGVQQQTEMFYGAGPDCVWGFSFTLGTLVVRFFGNYFPGIYRPAQYHAGVFNFDKTEIVFARDTGSPTAGTWPDVVTLRRRNSTQKYYCGPRPADADRRRWQLEYDKANLKWRLFSFSTIKTPKYELDDSNPCVGDTKTLNLVPPEDGDSGCTDAPATITLTRETDCSACTDYTEPGCQVMLVRQCGIDGYATYSYTPVSADPKLSILCAPTRGHDVQTCCDVDCDYTFSGCCPIQGTPFIGSMDPWFDRRGDIKVWDLDLAADPITLTGTFIEGNIVYEVDSYGLQCGGITKLNQASTTLPSSLARIYPLTACMVPDELLTCNVRVPSGTGTFPDGNFTSCASAGYTDFENGQQQFCDANDTCNPSILGSIQIGDCIVPVCATRQGEIKGRDPDCLTTYPRIACAYINDGDHDNIVTQVIYPVGPGNRWASDWYCTTYNPEDPNPRNCSPCSATIGAFKGTSYANKDECDTLPFFPTPTGGMGDCHCGELLCCIRTSWAPTLHYIATYGNPGSEITVTGTISKISGLDDVWQGNTFICSYPIVLNMYCNKSTGGQPVVGVNAEIPFTFTNDSVVCDPNIPIFQLIGHGMIGPTLFGTCPTSVPISITITL